MFEYKSVDELARILTARTESREVTANYGGNSGRNLPDRDCAISILENRRCEAAQTTARATALATVGFMTRVHAAMGWTLLRSPGPISPETYSGHIRRRAL